MTTPKPVGRRKGKGSGKDPSSPSVTVEAVPVKKNSAYSFFLSALPGIIIAIAGTLWSRGGGGGGGRLDAGVHNSVSVDIEASTLKDPSPGSWVYGFYTTQTVSDQTKPSTHALLYPNGGGGEPELVSFANREEFLMLGRLYNDRGQIVQSPSHFLNGTALYKGPQRPGTHFHWPAGEYIMDHGTNYH